MPKAKSARKRKPYVLVTDGDLGTEYYDPRTMRYLRETDPELWKRLTTAPAEERDEEVSS